MGLVTGTQQSNRSRSSPTGPRNWMTEGENPTNKLKKTTLCTYITNKLIKMRHTYRERT